MDVISIILIFIISIFILVIFHEYGHFIVARLNKVKVLNFAIGFGRSLLSYKGRRGTLYSINIFPLGGFVKMLDSRESTVSKTDTNFDFSKKHPLQKISIVLAGPIFNFILAFLCFFIMYQIGVIEQDAIIYDIEPDSVAYNSGMKFDFSSDKKNNIIIKKINDFTINNAEDVQLALANHIGDTDNNYVKMQVQDNDIIKKYNLDLKIIDFYNDIDLHKTSLARPLGIWMIPNKIQVKSVLENSPALKAGLKENDIIVGIKNKDLDIFDVLEYMKKNPNKKITLEVLRNGVLQYNQIIPDNKDGQGFLGIMFKAPASFTLKKYNFIESFNQSLNDTCKYIKKSFTMIFKLIFGEVGLENVHGPLMVAKVADKTWDIGISYFLKFLGIISIGLGVINLLPVPLLDGGHVIYHIIEWINPKWITKSVEEVWFKVGISFIVFLFFLAVYNDIKYW